MSSELTVEAVRAALGMYQLQARVAGTNIANANRPGAQAMRIDFGPLHEAMATMNGGSAGAWASAATAHEVLQSAVPATTGLPINLDAEVGTMAVATTQFQTLTEALSRQFGLMRLAVTGRT